MGALKKNECVVLVEKELFEDGTASDDDDPKSLMVHPDLNKSFVKFISHTIIGNFDNKNERDTENNT